MKMQCFTQQHLNGYKKEYIKLKQKPFNKLSFLDFMAARIQSPSSINTYKRCPRKYYYEYILGLQSLPSIHLIRGKITHSTLEDFFKIDIKFISKDHFEFELNILLNNLLKKNWEKSEKNLKELNLEKKEIDFYYRETLAMLDNWFRNFIRRLDKELNKSHNLEIAFKTIQPLTEAHIVSEKHQVQGFLDTVYKKTEGVFIVDYKTSKEAKITPEYRLQLAIYSLLYYEKYGVKPKKVGIDFLRHDIQFIDVDEQLMDFARQECKLIHEKTLSDNIEDYPKTPNKLCDYSSDCCKYYEQLIQQKKLADFTNKR